MEISLLVKLVETQALPAKCNVSDAASYFVEFITRRTDGNSIHDPKLHIKPPSYQKSLGIRCFVEFITP